MLEALHIAVFPLALAGLLGLVALNVVQNSRERTRGTSDEVSHSRTTATMQGCAAILVFATLVYLVTG